MSPTNGIRLPQRAAWEDQSASSQSENITLDGVIKGGEPRQLGWALPPDSRSLAASERHAPLEAWDRSS